MSNLEAVAGKCLIVGVGLFTLGVVAGGLYLMIREGDWLFACGYGTIATLLMPAFLSCGVWLWKNGALPD